MTQKAQGSTDPDIPAAGKALLEQIRAARELRKGNETASRAAARASTTRRQRV